MSAEQIDHYLRGVEEPKRSTLAAVRRMILEIVPDAPETISYRVPAFRVDGAIVAGFAAFRDHLSYLPFSGSVLAQLPDGKPTLSSALCRVLPRRRSGDAGRSAVSGRPRTGAEARDHQNGMRRDGSARVQADVGKGSFDDARVTGARRVVLAVR